MSDAEAYPIGRLQRRLRMTTVPPDAHPEPYGMREVRVADINVRDRMRKLQEFLVTELAASMRETGLIQAISITRPNNQVSPVLVAGLHRLEAAKRLKWEVIRCVELPWISDDETRLVEIDENLIRGELTSVEQAAHHQKRKAIYERLHPETKLGATGRQRGKVHQTDEPNVRYTAKAAREIGKSESSVQRHIRRAETIPDITRLVDTSLNRPEELDALVKLPKDRRNALIDRALKGEKVTAKTVAKQARREEREAALAEATKAASAKLGARLYGVVYIDPPWDWEPYSRETGLDRSAENHYPTMSIDNIKAIRIPAAPDCVCFCWATIPMLPQSLEALAAWGFTYRSAYAWVKTGNACTGYWSRNQLELLLVATRGDVAAPAQGAQPPQVITLPRGPHSAKPVEFADMIEKLFPTSPTLEMFARPRIHNRPNWDCWGNEAEEAG